MSRRKRGTRDPTGERAPGARGRESGRTLGDPAPDTSNRETPRMLGDPAPDASNRESGRILGDIAVLLLAFGAGVGIAELFGAANLGVALGVGQITFAIALVVLLTRG